MPPASKQNRRGAQTTTKGRSATPAARPVWETIEPRRIAALLKFVSDPTRLQVILILGAGIQSVGALCELIDSKQPALSHHLALLRHGNIVEPERVGKNNFYALTPIGKRLAEMVPRLVG